MKKAPDGRSTIGVSTAALNFDSATIADLERYIDVNRGECVFAKGILLVEGPAEEYIAPALAKVLGFDFDQLGISVCSVDGVNFEPYVRLFGPQGLDIPFAVITDKDPQPDGEPALGDLRVSRLVRILRPDAVRIQPNEELLETATGLGIFLNEHTLEVDLFRSGQHRIMCSTIAELTTNRAMKGRCAQWGRQPNSLNVEQFIKDVTQVGKGRFAQRLASQIENGPCPAYISEAIRYVASQLC